MPSYEFEGRRPSIHPDAFVAPTATLIGDVVVEQGASIWFGVVLRGDLCSIRIREGSNVQDLSIVHSRTGQTFELGPFSTIAHGCVVHGDVIGSHSVIGNGAVISSSVVIGSGAVVAAGSVVPPGASIPDGVVAMGVPARIRGAVEEGSQAHHLTAHNAAANMELARRYRSL